VLTAASLGKSSRWPYIFTTLICLAVWAALLPVTYQANPWIYSWDSVAYIETANSIHAGRGLMQRSIDGINPAIWEPISWWPPGYPILIALVQAGGLSAQDAGLAVAIVAGGISVVVIAFMSLQLFSWPQAFLIALLTITAPTFLQISTQCMSDTSYFLFVTASVLCLVVWTLNYQSSYSWVFAAGVLAGAAWGTRYAALGLFAATGAFFLLHLYMMSRERVVKVIAAWTLGVAVFGLPLLIRNLTVFGTINPYHMRKSELSLWHNIGRTAKVVVEDITTSGALANLIGNWLGIFIVVAAIAALVTLAIWRPKAKEALDLLYRRRIEVLLVVYALIYSSIIIAARTKYRWGQEIDTRHMVQIYFAIWICGVAAATSIISRIGYRAIAGTIVSALLIVGAVLQFRMLHERVRYPADQSESVEAKIGDAAVKYLAGEVGPQQIVLSARAHLLRLYSNINARKLPHKSQIEFLPWISLEQINKMGREGFLWGITVEDVDGARNGDFGSWVKTLVEEPDSYEEFRQVRIPGPLPIFKFVGKKEGS
jgi:hypothetical protein